jgi:predicted component of type VI protein secretion system
MDAKLRILSGPTAGELIAVSGGRLLVGRDEECHLKPVSEFVSRHHCVLLLDEFTFRVQDLGSKNGTFVNGRRIGAGETILLHDDLVAIGEIICQIDLTQADGKRPSAPQAETLSLATPALIATDVFEGDTVQPDFSVKSSSNSDRGGPSTSSPDAGTNTEMPKSTGK